MRERWFGATGRQVPEIALEGELDVDGRVSSWTSGTTDELHAAFEQGGRSSSAPTTPKAVKAALAHPEVACVLVRDRALLELDLVELTYG